MEMNLKILALSALIPLLVGFIWYNPKTLGTAWMNASGLTEEDLKGANMGKIFALSYLFSFMAATFIQTVAIHQFGFYSILMNEPGFGQPDSEIMLFISDFMTKYGQNFRTFGHGTLHGAVTGLFLVLPVLGTNALFERKSFKYIAINAGYWTVSFALMGGVICAYA